MGYDALIKHIKAIGNLGTDLPDRNESFYRLVRIINYANLLGLACFIFYIILYAIVDFQSYLPVIITILLFSPFFFLSLLMNKMHKYLWSRFYFQLAITVSILACTAIFVGKTTGVHYFFLVFAAMPALVWTVGNILIGDLAVATYNILRRLRHGEAMKPRGGFAGIASVGLTPNEPRQRGYRPCDDRGHNDGR
mgnify:CR=1 FL=1